MGRWAPELRVHETGHGCRLTLVGLTYGNGHTLQEAADDLAARLRSMIRYTRASGLRIPSTMGLPDHRVLELLWELADIAARGGDIRERVLGFGETADDTLS